MATKLVVEVVESMDIEMITVVVTIMIVVVVVKATIVVVLR